MGDEMEFPAKQLIKQVTTNAKCKVLSNCHLSLEFRAELEDNLWLKDEEVHVISL
jgi:hypothetical protein